MFDFSFPTIPGVTAGGVTSTPKTTPTPAKSNPVLGTVWGYPGDSLDGGLTAWGVNLKDRYDRNILGVSLPTEGKYAVPLSTVPLGGLVDVYSSQTEKTVRLPRIDKGPAAWTNKGVDLTFNAARALGLDPKEGTFAGLYVTPTSERVDKSRLAEQFSYTGLDWIAPGVKNAMTEAPRNPIDWKSPTGGSSPVTSGIMGAANPLSWLTINTAEKFFVTAGFGIAILVLTVSLLQDKTPVQVVSDAANSVKNKAETAAKAAALVV